MAVDPAIDRHPTLHLIGRTPLVEARLFQDRRPATREKRRAEESG